MQGIGDGSGVYLAPQPVDFRRGIAALSVYAREHLGLEPVSEVVLVFRSRRPGRVRVLHHDGSGMVLGSKWPDRERFFWPPITEGVLRFVDRIVQYLPDCVVNRKVPGHFATARAIPDRREFSAFLAQPQMQLAPAPELGKLSEHQGNRIPHPPVRIHLDPTLPDLHIADRQGREQLATAGLLPLRLAGDHDAQTRRSSDSGVTTRPASTERMRRISYPVAVRISACQPPVTGRRT